MSPLESEESTSFSHSPLVYLSLPPSLPFSLFLSSSLPPFLPLSPSLSFPPSLPLSLPLSPSPSPSLPSPSPSPSLPSQVWLSAVSGKGMEISGAFVRRNGVIYADLTFTNKALSPISEFAVQFNKNRCVV